MDGWRETWRAMQAGLDLIGIYACDESGSTSADHEDRPAVLERARELSAFFPVGNNVLEKIGYGQSVRGVVSEFEQPESSLETLSLKAEPLILVLDQIEKPGNLGAIYRCADAAGVDAVVLCDCACDRFNPNAIRSSLGTVFSVPSASAQQPAVSRFLSLHSIRPLAARVESSEEFWNVDYRGAVAIVLGSEAKGLGQRWSDLNGAPIGGIRIPMNGHADSLNVATAAALLAFQAVHARL